jgi:hypothetical protein
MQVLDASGLAPLDAVSWHLYATQSTTCPIVIDEAIPERLFDETLNEQHRGFARIMREVAGDLPVWNTESASAQCGGQHGLSDTLADALWYADWFGLMAEEGTSLVIRHALVGADYSLLDKDTFNPRPTLLALALMTRTVRKARLATTVDRTALKAHGFCRAGAPGNVTVVAANPGPDPLVAEIDLRPARVVDAEQWTLAGPEGLGSFTATINGESPAADGTLPDPPGHPVVIVGGRAYAEVAAETLAFVTLETDPPVAACQGP